MSVIVQIMLLPIDIA